MLVWVLKRPHTFVYSLLQAKVLTPVSTKAVGSGYYAHSTSAAVERPGIGDSVQTQVLLRDQHGVYLSHTLKGSWLTRTRNVV